MASSSSSVASRTSNLQSLFPTSRRRKTSIVEPPPYVRGGEKSSFSKGESYLAPSPILVYMQARTISMITDATLVPQPSSATERLPSLDPARDGAILDLGMGDDRVAAEFSELVRCAVAVGQNSSSAPVAHSYRGYTAVRANLESILGEVQTLRFRRPFDRILSSAAFPRRETSLQPWTVSLGFSIPVRAPSFNAAVPGAWLRWLRSPIIYSGRLHVRRIFRVRPFATPPPTTQSSERCSSVQTSFRSRWA